MAHLMRMHKMRKDADMFIVSDDNDDFEHIKQIVVKREKLNEKLDQI
mgnify:FL=1